MIARKRLLAAVTLFLCVSCTGEFPAESTHFKVANEQADLEKLIHSLNSIKAWHARNSTGVESALYPGIAGDTLAGDLIPGCHLSEELEHLWGWHDGESAPAPFVWYHDFLTQQQAISARRWLILNPFLAWDPNYIPILSFEGEWYAAYCGDEDGRTGPMVHVFVEDQPRLVAINVTTFMAMMAEVFEQGAVTWEEGSMVEVIGQVKAIHQAHNPGMAFPYFSEESVRVTPPSPTSPDSVADRRPCLSGPRRDTPTTAAARCTRLVRAAG